MMVSCIEALAFAVPVLMLSTQSESLRRLRPALEKGGWGNTPRHGDAAWLAINSHGPESDEGSEPSGSPKWSEPDQSIPEARAKLRRAILLGIPLGILSWLLILWAAGIL